MKNVTEILRAYTKGVYTVEKANAELKAAGATIYIDEFKNALTPDEIVNGTAGLLDSGTVTLDKVFIDPEKMELTNCDMGSTFALCIVQGKTYKVEGKKLVEN